MTAMMYDPTSGLIDILSGDVLNRISCLNVYSKFSNLKFE